MTPTDVRESLTAVSATVAVPTLDATAFGSRVTRARRRRTTARVLAAAACVAVLAVGISLVPRSQPAPVAPAEQPPIVSAPSVPVVVGGRLRLLAADGSLGPAGPEVATVVGQRATGVVAFLADGRLAEIAPDGAVTVLVGTPVRSAYLQGDDVLYDDFDLRVRRLAEDDTTTRVDDGRLLAAGADGYVVLDEDGLVAHDATGAHELWLGDDTTSVRQVRVGGGKISVVTEDHLFVFDADGARSAGTPGDGIGALAPDGSAYARPTSDRGSAEVLDADSLAATPVAGTEGAVREVGWTPDGDLLVVTSGARLWRCPDATGCTEVLSGRGPLRLR